MKEHTATITCPQCEKEWAKVYAVEVGSNGVRQNMTEPASMQGVTICPDCQGLLVTARV